MNYLKTFLVGLVCCSVVPTYAQILSKAEIESSANQYLKNSLLTFKDFLAMPNDGDYPEQIETNLQWCDKAFNDLGFETRKIFSKGVPHLYAQKIIDPKKKSVLFYLQIDGQPVDSSAWNQPSPFQAVIKDKNGELVDWKSLDTAIDPDYEIYARSASDSKGPASCFMTALKIMRDKGVAADFNVKVIMDFQEEISSPTIAQLVHDHRDLLVASTCPPCRFVSPIPITISTARTKTFASVIFGKVSRCVWRC